MAAVPSSSVSHAVDSAFDEWVKAFNNRDAKALGLLMTDDYTCQMAGVPTMKGKEAGVEAIAQAFDTFLTMKQSIRESQNIIDHSSQGHPALVIKTALVDVEVTAPNSVAPAAVVAQVCFIYEKVDNKWLVKISTSSFTVPSLPPEILAGLAASAATLS